MSNINASSQALARGDYVLEAELQVAARPDRQADGLRGFVLFALVGFLPFFFGGVNFYARYLSSAFVFLYLLGLLSTGRIEPLAIEGRSASAFFQKITLAMLGYFCFQYFYFGMPNDLLDTLISWTFFFAVVWLALDYLRTGRAFELQSTLIFSAFLLSLVALAHWYYDNGKLFWTFEPQAVYVSERARWPFVNPNHLGNFLLLAFFIVLARVQEIYQQLHGLVLEFAQRKGGLAKAAFRSRRIHARLFRLGLVLIVLLAVALAITATLSRGTWTGLGLGLVLYLAVNYFYGDRNISLINLIQFPNRSRSRRSTDSWRLLALKAVKPLLFLAMLAVFVFFLNEQGQQLVEGRIEYGLLYTLEDIRWTMYSDTLRMVADHLFFGVGLGQWAARYPAYMNEALSGLVVAYLHSEPLQILAELGLVGSLILLWFVGSIFTRAVKTIVMWGATNARELIAASCGVVGFIVATFVEFPLRMPAVQAMLAIAVAFILYYLDCFHSRDRVLEDT